MKKKSKDVFEMARDDYSALLSTAVAQITAARNAIAVSVNTTAISTYWGLGKLLHDRKVEYGYGGGVVKRLSADLKARFPDMGFSPRNMWNMKLFYERYAGSGKKLLQAVAVLRWGHNLLLLNKKLSDDETLFYAQECAKKNWNRDLLLNAIKMRMHLSGVPATRSNNFAVALPESQAAVANDILKDSYNLGFLGLAEPVAERELERRLIEKIKIFMLELGRGFAFIGNQYRLECNGKEYFVDMLFTNRRLNCLVAIDLKIGPFRSEYVGKMNMYLSLLDRMERLEGENQSIGIILCAEKDHIDVELALQDIRKPIAVSDYELVVPKRELQQLVLDEIAIVEGRNETKHEPQGETARRPSASPRRRRQSSTPATPESTDDEVLE